jgi:hypothetical protein
MLDRLATPGGISELGLGVMAKEDALGAWSRALDAVLARMGGRT